MEIILHVSRSAAGRFTGTARLAGEEPVPFSGILDLVACLERLVVPQLREQQPPSRSEPQADRPSAAQSQP